MTVTVLSQDKKSNLNFKKGLNLLTTLKEHKIDIQSSCMGNGTCGKCKIKILEGELKPTDTDLRHFSQKEIQDGLRLACCAYPLENCTIKIATEQEKDFRILDSFRKSNGEIKSIVEQRNIEFENEELENNISLVQIINKKLGREYSFSLNSLVKLSRIINKCSAYSFNNNFYKLDKICLIIQDDYVLDIQMVNERHVYGIAVDLGTTTIVASLVNLLNGEVIKSCSILNSQRKFGEDVISRIQYSASGNLDELKNVVREDILSALAELLTSTGVNREKVFSMVIAGNTTMQSLLLGLHCESLTAHPFKTVTISEHKIRFRDIFISDILECEVIVLSGISAYVGADIVAGMLYCNFDKLNQNAMLIDIGTNGEIVIGSKEKILCLATAAGPAFEGGNITNGIGSVTGAIHEVKMINNEIRYNTINDSAPIGICGSGVLDIVSTGLLNNSIDKTGRFSQKIDGGVLEIAKNASNEAIIFTQKDIREVQLAKSAIRTGIEILIKRLNVSYDEIETVYIAGGFGTYMDIESAIRIGMIPKEFKGKIKIVGNSSLGGAITYLINKKSREKINNILEKATYIDISSDRTFNDLFVENMFFLEN
ncbi:MAG: hypothetical protein JM58_10270 [Peptococcaceae bacterium BICA1-8]|nr:MAG: hypothetical protein JM58_10270 [Peptococcaceae bacterium BICA1-8]